MNKISISLREQIMSIGSEKLDEIFEKNTYMKELYPVDTRSTLEVFCLYDAQGEYFDIRNPTHIVRESVLIGKNVAVQTGYFASNGCIGCKLCYLVCHKNALIYLRNL